MGTTGFDRIAGREQSGESMTVRLSKYMSTRTDDCKVVPMFAQGADEVVTLRKAA